MEHMTDAQAREIVLDMLKKLDIPFEIAAHPAAHTMEDCKVPEELLGGVMPKNLFLRPRRQEEFYLCVTRPDALLRTSQVSRQAGSSRLGFASEEELLRIMHARAGAAGPLSLLFEEAKDVHLLIDERLKNEPRLIFHPCENTHSVALSGADFFNRLLPAVEKIPLFVTLDTGGISFQMSCPNEIV